MILIRNTRTMFATACIIWAIFTIGVFIFKYDPNRNENMVQKETETIVEVKHTEPEPIDQSEVKQIFFREDVPLDYELQESLYNSTQNSGIQYELALAVIKKETSFRNICGDGGNSHGYMQIQTKWHKERMERLGVTNLDDPKQNFIVGCDLLSELVSKYGNLEDALTCYNSGHSGKSTYSNSVLQYMNEFLETKS